MKPFCDIIVTDVLPAIRALVAKELMQTYGLNQSETSKRLGVTQPAISQYRRELRGGRVRMLRVNKEVVRMIKELAASVSVGDAKNVAVQEKFCDICAVVRREKLICKQHFADSKSCNVCLK
jgi:hypothetical protein